MLKENKVQLNDCSAKLSSLMTSVVTLPSPSQYYMPRYTGFQQQPDSPFTSSSVSNEQGKVVQTQPLEISVTIAEEYCPSVNHIELPMFYGGDQ